MIGKENSLSRRVMNQDEGESKQMFFMLLFVKKFSNNPKNYVCCVYKLLELTKSITVLYIRRFQHQYYCQ